MKQSLHALLTSAMFAAAATSSFSAGAAEAALMQKTERTDQLLYGPPPESIALGDINDDKQLDVRDLALLKRMVINSRGQIALDEVGDPDGDGFVQIWSWGDSTLKDSIYVGDLNQDQLINKEDVKALVRLLTGKPEEEKAETEPVVTTTTTTVMESEMTQTSYGPPPAWK